MPPALRVLVHVGHPLDLLRCREHVRAEVAPGDIKAHPPLQVQAKAVGVGVSDDKIVLVNDAHVPLAVDALLAVVVGEGGVEALGLIAANSVIHEELGVLGGRGLGRDGGHHTAGHLFSLGRGKAGLWLRHDCEGSFDYLLYLALGQPRLRLWRVRHRIANGPFYICGGESGLRLRRCGPWPARCVLSLRPRRGTTLRLHLRRRPRAASLTRLVHIKSSDQPSVSHSTRRLMD